MTTPKLQHSPAESASFHSAQLTGGTLVMALSTASDDKVPPEAFWPDGLGTVLIGIALPFETPGNPSTMAKVEIDLDRGFESSREERRRRVLALRTWLDSLPYAPPIPAGAIDRSELY